MRADVGGFSMNKMNDAKALFAGASSLFKGIQHRNDPQAPDGLANENFVEGWEEAKDVRSFMGCRSVVFLSSIPLSSRSWE